MKYLLFGTGDYYMRYKSWFKQREVVALLDNSVAKQGTYIDGIPVISPQDVNLVVYDVIVIMSFYVYEMKMQLLNLGVDKNCIYHFFDLHELFAKDVKKYNENIGKRILLLSHDLSLGGPSLALFNAAKILKESQYDVYIASMINGPLIDLIIENNIPVSIDNRLQISTMNELLWTKNYDLIICNTISYHVFLSDRDNSIPVIWWLHDARRYYDGIKEERLKDLDTENMRILSVGPIPAMAIREFLPDVNVDSLLYGVTPNV